MSRHESAAPAMPADAGNVMQPVPDRPQVFVGWNEIIDANSRIAGYVLRPQCLTPDGDIDGAALAKALIDDGATRFTGRRSIVMPVTAMQWLTGDFQSLVAAGSYFQLVGAQSLSAGDVLGLCDEMRTLGAKVAAGTDLFTRSPTLAQAVDLLIMDVEGASLPVLEVMVQVIRRNQPGVRLIAEGVQSWSEHRLYLSMGFAGCMGRFVSAPDDAVQEDRLGQDRAVIIDMLNALRSEAELSDLSASAKRDPAMVVKLLEMANSSFYGMPRDVASLEDAIVVLGRDVLYRWLALALFRIGGDGGRDQTLLVLALCRAVFLESLAADGDQRQADELYLVGLFSVLDCLFGLPMSKVLEKVRLPDPVVAVLLNSEGPYAKHLLLTMAMERCRLNQATALGSAIGVEISTVVGRYSDAMKLATSELIA